MKSNVTEKWEKEFDFMSKDPIRAYEWSEIKEFIKKCVSSSYHQGVEDGKAEVMKIFSEEREKLLKGFGYKKEIKELLTKE